MLVFELPLQICFLIPMPSENVSERIARLLDAAEDGILLERDVLAVSISSVYL